MTTKDCPIPVRQTDPRAGYLAQPTAIGVAHAIGCANGTDAIELALRACNIGAGDLVFTVSHTAVATVAAIERAGATPVLIDIEADGFAMDPAELEQALKT